MKNKVLLFILMINLFGCASVVADFHKINPNEYGIDQRFNNRLFIIKCIGNGRVDSSYVEKKCLNYISDIAYENSYDYFSIIKSYNGSTTQTGSYTLNTPVTTYSHSTISNGYSTYYGNSSSTTYIPETTVYNITRSYINYFFVLIRSNELKDYSNFYKVSDYLND